MHMMVILILMTAAYQQNTVARAIGECERWSNTPNAVPVEKQPVNTRYRIQCEKGYVRKAGTSSLIICKENNGNMYWDNKPPLECIRDPKLPVTKTTTSTTERTEIKNPTSLGTSRPTTATGHISLTTTNEVVTTKTRRTTRLTTLKSMTKEAESFTTANEITSTNSTSSSFTSRDYKTTTSSHTPSSSIASRKGVTVCVNTSAVSEENNALKVTTGSYTPTVVGISSIIIICLVAAVFLFWWRSRHRERDSPEASYVPVHLVRLNTDQLNQT